MQEHVFQSNTPVVLLVTSSFILSVGIFTVNTLFRDPPVCFKNIFIFISLAQDRDRRQDLVNAVMNLRVS
jgi:hypothetical protein